jgi:DMSO/TMAO reductase YedYZ heme-binding membrane subunit
MTLFSVEHLKYRRLLGTIAIIYNRKTVHNVHFLLYKKG